MRRHRNEKAWSTITSVATAMALALTMACSGQPGDETRRTAAARQNTQNDGEANLGARTVTGTVKQVVDDGIVVFGREEGESDREWAFAIESGTRIDRAGQLMGAGSLREGDTVTVVCTNRDGKIVARSVTSGANEMPASGSR